MPYVLVLLVIITLPLILTHGIRRRRDVVRLTEHVRQHGGQLNHLTYVRRGSPFANAGRAFWAWRVEWKDARGEHTNWALTSRQGIQEWRD